MYQEKLTITLERSTSSLCLRLGAYVNVGECASYRHTYFLSPVNQNPPKPRFWHLSGQFAGICMYAVGEVDYHSREITKYPISKVGKMW